MRTGVAGRSGADENLSKSDRLFRAAISGFCALTSPSRLDASRLDQLALPLLPLVSEESKRFAAATLSRCFPGPQGLVRRLAEEDTPISAPILVGSPVLSDVDLIGLIGRHGMGHASAIGRRQGLNPNIAALITALGAAGAAASLAPSAEPSDEPVASTRPAVEPVTADEMHRPAPSQPTPTVSKLAAVTPSMHASNNVASAFDEVVRAEPGAAEDVAREKLRAMMQPAGSRAPSRAHPDLTSPPPGHEPLDWDAALKRCSRLVTTGLLGRAAFFHTALADAFDIEFKLATAIGEDGDVRRLATALKAAALPTAEAFLIAALAFPPRFATTASIRNFIETYASINQDHARRTVEGWRMKSARPAQAEQRIEVANQLEKPRSHDWRHAALRSS